MTYEGQPTKVRILGIDYEISIYPSKQNENYGQCRNDTCEIEISNCNSEDHAKAVLLHEIIEALNFRLDLKLEHEQINLLEAGLFQVLRDNPISTEFITK